MATCHSFKTGIQMLCIAMCCYSVFVDEDIVTRLGRRGGGGGGLDEESKKRRYWDGVCPQTLHHPNLLPLHILHLYCLFVSYLSFFAFDCLFVLYHFSCYSITYTHTAFRHRVFQHLGLYIQKHLRPF